MSDETEVGSSGGGDASSDGGEGHAVASADAQPDAAATPDNDDDESEEMTDPGISSVMANDYTSLIEAAKRVRHHAHAPYSMYKVGAAILTRAGNMYVGCNVENSSYGATICAERSAITAMIAAGDRDPIACVIVTAGERAASPCGICRQVLYEFADDMDLVLMLDSTSGDVRRDTTLAALLPDGFRLAR